MELLAPAHFVPDLFIPRYSPRVCGAWTLDVIGMGFMPGYWSGTSFVADVAALHRQGATWMSITPLELESQGIGVRLAHGHVLICGLGLGWAAAACAMRDAVRAVTVIEFDPEVIELHRELNLFAQLSPGEQAKLRIVQGDALTWQPDGERIDFLMPDIWLPLIDDVRLDHVRQMQANVGAGAIHFWGQELIIARAAIAAGRTIDAAGIAATVAEWGLPLVGPELPDYAAWTLAAARQHLPELAAA